MRLFRSARRPIPPVRHHQPRPRLEFLEDRTLLSVLDFVQTHYVIKHPAGMAAPFNTSGPTGYSPDQVRHGYGFDQISFGGVAGDGTGITIAIVDAFDNPSFVSSTNPNFSNSDLHQFDVQFGLPDPVFTKVNQTGGSVYPTPDFGWASEIALDVEWSHAIAPKAKIFLVEATDNSDTNMFSAVIFAAHQPGVGAVSMSWGGDEASFEGQFDGAFFTPTGHSGVTFVASSGDSGAPPIYPAVSPNVLGVGGTHLDLDGQGNFLAESGWGGSGGGISSYENQPAYQVGLVIHNGTVIISQHGKRASPDVAYDADPYSGFPVYDSYNNGSAFPWSQFGGTSAGAPQWAALIAIADQGRALAGRSALDGRSQTLPMLYQLSAADFHDITSGSSFGTPVYTAGPGYDLVTGRGTPIANTLVADLVSNSVLTATMTTVSASVATPVFGQSITFTATVIPSGPGTPTGTVTFLDGSTNIGQRTLSGGPTVTLSYTPPTTGSHTITASYSGNSTFASSSGSLTRTVSRANTSTAVTSSQNPSAIGQPVTFTATISPQSPGAGTPTGTVTFLDGSTIRGQGTLTTNSGGVTSVSFSLSSSGPHTITASYNGDSNFASSSGSLTQTVTQASGTTPTTTSVSSSAPAPVVGQPVTFTATVSPGGPGTPTGAVTFSDGSTNIGQRTLSGGATTVTLSYTPPAAGNHTITASYSGDSTFASSSGSLTQPVGQANTNTTVSSSQNPSVTGQTVTFTATISVQSPGAGTPTGPVIFYDGNTSMGQGTLTTGSGGMTSASFSLSSTGPHTIAASYNGDSNFVSSSGSLTQTVNQGSTAMVIEDFEHGLGLYHSTSGFTSARTSPAAAHDGSFGLDMPNGKGWLYRNDAAANVQQGQTISVWVQIASFSVGRAYFGFGASTAGTLSLVMAPDIGQLILQDNSGYGFTNLATVPQSYQVNHWYQLRVLWGVGGNITGCLYDSNGTTLLQSVQATDNNITAGGVAFLATTYDKYFDTVTVTNTVGGAGGPAAKAPGVAVPQSAADISLAYITPPASGSSSLSTPVAASSSALSASMPAVPFTATSLAPAGEETGLGSDEALRSRYAQAGENSAVADLLLASQERLVTDAYFARISLIG